MKFIVDTLPYYGDPCPLEDNCYADKSDCPRNWNKYKVCSEENPRECWWLKEKNGEET